MIELSIHHHLWLIKKVMLLLLYIFLHCTSTAKTAVEIIIRAGEEPIVRRTL